jgi:Family of unknown function (DUF5906)
VASIHITSSQRLVGNFNGHLANKSFIFADEAMYVGDRKGEQVIKGLITETVMEVENKGINSYSQPVGYKILMATNSEYAVPASRDARRYCVVDVSSERIGDKAYFDALFNAIADEDVLSSFLHEMLNRDLSGVNIREVPATEALKHQREGSLCSVGKFIMDVIASGALPNTPSGLHHPWNAEVHATELHQYYIGWCDDMRHDVYSRANITTFGRYLSKIGVKKRKSNSNTYRVLGSLAELNLKLCTYEKLSLDDFDDDDIAA